VLTPDSALWFAVQVAPQHEHKVSIQLRHKGQEEFLPLLTVRRQWSDRSKTSERPLFPGYVFCRIQRSAFALVLGTLGVYRIVSFGGHAYPISDDEILCLRQIVQSRRNVSAIPYFTEGQKVQVTDGPLAGIMGAVARIKNRDRLVISVDILMRSVAVDISMSEIAVCESSARCGHA
jgi:transcription antitermination factor NusG